MKMLVGLGNPGSEYEQTRHNLGFLVLDRLCQLFETEFRLENKFKAQICFLTKGDNKVIFVKPQTFMNLSGEAISLIKNYYQLENKDIWVVADELDLPLGKIRIRQNDKSTTHNGLKSIISNIGQDFTRIRLGISNDLNLPAEVFVLSKFNQSEKKLVDQVVEESATLITRSLEQGTISDHTIDLVV